MVSAGDIVVFNATKGDWFSKAQRFFTRMPFTHSGVIVGTLNGEVALLEAKMATTVTPWKDMISNDTMEYFVFRPTVSADIGLKPLNDLWRNHTGQTYGFAQILWFVYRYIMESWPFRADVRSQKNWFPTGHICSEVVFHWLEFLSISSPLLDALVSQWNENTCHSGDIYTICSQSRIEFDLIEYRKL